jgi:hypothetical protein
MPPASECAVVNGYKIEKDLREPGAVLRISGNIQAEDIPQLTAEIRCGTRIEALDLEEIRLVSREVIRLLAAWEAEGIELRNCPRYVRVCIFEELGGLGSRA